MNIEITDDGIVSFCEKKILKQVSMEDFLKNLSESRSIESGMIPENCIAFSKYLDSTIYIIEEKPRIGILNWSYRGFEISPYPISLPFLYWSFKVGTVGIIDIKVRASLSPVKSLDTRVYGSGLPNFHANGLGGMCKGQIKIDDNIHNVKLLIKNTINGIWDSNWNGDLSPQKPKNIISYEDWADKTLLSPLFWRKLELPEGSGSLQDLINENK